MSTVNNNKELQPVLSRTCSTDIDVLKQKNFNTTEAKIHDLVQITDEGTLQTALKNNEISLSTSYTCKGEATSQDETVSLGLLAIGLGNTKLLEVFKEQLRSLDFGDGIKPAHIAAASPKGKEILQILKEQKCDLNPSDNENTHPVLIAIEEENLDVLGFYIREGFNFYEEDEDTNTPIDFAAEKASAKVLEYLLKKGVSLNKNAKGEDDDSALILAASRLDIQVNDLLVKYNYDPHQFYTKTFHTEFKNK